MIPVQDNFPNLCHWVIKGLLGANYIAVHFAKFQLDDSLNESITFSDSEGNILAAYTGTGTVLIAILIA
jgi:hypothetical protein